MARKAQSVGPVRLEDQDDDELRRLLAFHELHGNLVANEARLPGASRETVLRLLDLLGAAASVDLDAVRTALTQNKPEIAQRELGDVGRELADAAGRAQALLDLREWAETAPLNPDHRERLNGAIQFDSDSDRDAHLAGLQAARDHHVERAERVRRLLAERQAAAREAEVERFAQRQRDRARREAM